MKGGSLATRLGLTLVACASIVLWLALAAVQVHVASWVAGGALFCRPPHIYGADGAAWTVALTSVGVSVVGAILATVLHPGAQLGATRLYWTLAISLFSVASIVGLAWAALLTIAAMSATSATQVPLTYGVVLVPPIIGLFACIAFAWRSRSLHRPAARAIFAAALLIALQCIAAGIFIAAVAAQCGEYPIGYEL